MQEGIQPRVAASLLLLVGLAVAPVAASGATALGAPPDQAPGLTPGEASHGLAAPADTTVLTVRTFDANLDFEPGTIVARQGEVVRIVYENQGVLPHNLVVVKDPDDISTLGQAAYDAQDTGFVPLEHEDLMVAHTDLASPGDTVEVTFTMPQAGEYTFVCLVAGHYNMMMGTLLSTE